VVAVLLVWCGVRRGEATADMLADRARVPEASGDVGVAVGGEATAAGDREEGETMARVGLVLGETVPAAGSVDDRGREAV